MSEIKCTWSYIPLDSLFRAVRVAMRKSDHYDTKENRFHWGAVEGFFYVRAFGSATRDLGLIKVRENGWGELSALTRHGAISEDGWMRYKPTSAIEWTPLDEATARRLAMSPVDRLSKEDLELLYK